jgi:hypothetical protein
MEFIKPNRYDRGRQQRNAPQPGDSRPTDPRPVQYTTLVDKTGTAHMPTPSQPPHVATKTAIISYARRFLFTKKVIIVSLVIMVVAGSLATGLLIHQRDIAKNSSNNKPNEAVEDLEYQTILPDGKSISELGGWKRVSPSKNDPVFAYVDKIGDISINVSEQPLPKSFIGDVDNQVTELAKKFNATAKIEVGDIKVYVGTSAKGPQSAIFTKNSLLILIKSQEKIDDTDWAKYTSSLN